MSAETLTAEAGQVRTYRAATLEELLPRIRAELGPEAVIVRQREGLVGGIGGFFQKRCVEVEARAGGGRVDVYDDGGDAGALRDDGPGPRVLPPDQGGPAGGGVLDPPGPGAPAAGANGVDVTGTGAVGNSLGTGAAGMGLGTSAGGGTAGAAGEGTGGSGSGAGEEAATVEFQALTREQYPVRNDVATREGLATPAMRTLVKQTQPFAELLDGLGADPAPGAEPGPGPAPGPGAEPPAPGTPAPAESRRVRSLREGLVAAGLGADVADGLVDSVLASAIPFASPGRLRTLVRDELALRLPVARAAAPGRRMLAVVGPAGAGKTAALARIAAAHAAVGDEVACFAVDPSDGGAALRALLGESGVAVEAVAGAELAAASAAAGGLVLVDTPAAWPGSGGVEALGAVLVQAGVGEVHLALRAGTAAGAGAELLEGLRPLAPNRLLVTATAETGHLGGVLDVAIRAELPLSYVAAGADSIAPADARALASRVTP